MKLCTVSHSHCAPRQQQFFKEVARQGHDVLVVAPENWGNLRTMPFSVSYVTFEGEGGDAGSFKLSTCKMLFGENIYAFHMLGAQNIVEEFEPDWLYIQAEPGSSLADEAVMWNVPKKALFTWENIRIKGGFGALEKYDLVVCGNPEAKELVKPYNPRVIMMLQVGVDMDHFQARPDVKRDIEVAYIGRPVKEKGVGILAQAWPLFRMLEWKDYLELPWWYSRAKMVVAYSQDTPMWKEQAPNYVVLEALACGCNAVVSDTAAMKFWLERCPGVVIAPSTGLGELSKINRLKEGIERALEIDTSSRKWVERRFGNNVMASSLITEFKHA